MDLKSELKKVISGTLMVRVFSVSATFLTSVLLARTLGAEGFGLYSFVYALIMLVALPCQIGIPVLLVRETAKLESEKSWSKMKGLWFWSGKTILMISALSCVTVFLFQLIKGDGDENQFLTYVFGVLLIPLISLGNCRAAALRGLRKIVKGQLPDAVVRPGFYLIFLTALWCADYANSASLAMGLNVVSAIIGFIVGGYLLVASSPSQIAKVEADYSDSKKWMASSLPLALIGGLQVLSGQTGIILLGLIHEESEAGIYKVAVSIATVMAFGLQIINMIVSPYAARFYHSGELSRLQKIATLGAVVGMSVSIPIFLLVLLAGEDFLSMIYGAGFAMAASPLLILAFGQLVNTFFGSTGTILNMTGNEKVAAKWFGVSAVFNVIASVILIPFYGVVGGIIAFGFAVEYCLLDSCEKKYWYRWIIVVAVFMCSEF